MTTLAITPNWKNKSAKFKGTVAAGEHVSVTIQNDNGEGAPFIGDASTLRLRVVDPCNGRTLAIFPEPVPEGETPEEWDSDLSPLRCTLNLNTVQMLKAVPPAANVPLLWVLDDYENKTLYFKEQFPVEHWPRLRGEEEPTDLDNYKDIIADFNTRLDSYNTRITGAENAVRAATENASTAAATANQAVVIANQAFGKAETAQNSAAASAEAARNSELAAVKAQEKAEEAQEAAESAQQAAATSAAEAAESAAAFVVDDTLSVEGAAADAKAVGEANQDLITQINTVQDNLNSEVTARETLAAAVGDNRQNLAAEIARAQSAEQGLENRKADKTAVAAAIQAETSRAQTAERDLRAEVSSAQSAIADRYTKAEVDTKIAGVQTFGKVVVQTLPDLADADDKTIYLVPRADSEAPDLCDEYVVVEEDGVRRWERIGAKAVDMTLDNTVTRTSANGVKSSGIWAMIWGALAALPTDFSSLYDWCVAQLAGKANIFTPAEISETQGILSVWADVRNGTTIYETEIPTNTALAGKASKSDATLTSPYWTIDGGSPFYPDLTIKWFDAAGQVGWVPFSELYGGACGDAKGDVSSTELSWTSGVDISEEIGSITATRSAAYQLGSQTDKPLASEAEAEALRTAVAGKLDSTSAAPAFNPAQYYDFGDLVTKDGILYQCEDANVVPGSWDPTSWGVRTVFDIAAKKGDIPYSFGDPIVIDAASSGPDGETVYYGAAALADRTANIVQVTAPLDELRITFPAETSGKVRDFGLRVEIGTGSAALTAPALVPIAPTGETIKIENNAKQIPALADGTATAKGVTLLYFSETAPRVFVVKGEQVEEVL